MFWDPLFEHVASLAGAPPSQIKLIFSFLVSYPLGSLFVRIPPDRPNLAHIFSLVISLFFYVPLLNLGRGLAHLLFSCAGTYALVVGSRSANMPWMVFAFVMGHLSLNHLRLSFKGTPIDEIEITTSQMVLVMKLTMFAWNVHDGRRKPEELDAGQLTTRLLHVPSPLAFLGYCFFFPSSLVGPSMDYATYDALVKHTLYSQPTAGTEDPQGKLKRRVPHGRKRVAYLHLVIGLFFLGVYAIFGTKASYERILTPAWYTWGLATRFGFVQVAGFIARTKYYAAWSLSEGACILTGIGFNGYDPRTGRTLWNRVRNIDIVAIESAESFKVLFDSWNCRTNVWLRDCIYKRLVTKGKKPGTKQSMATFLTSAFWHGHHLGYYAAFTLAGVLTSLGRQLRTYVRPYFLPSPSASQSSPNALPRYPYPNTAKRVYDIIGWIMVQSNLNFTASAFILLSFRKSMVAWKRMWFYSPVLALLAMAFFHFGGRAMLRRGLQSKKGVEGVPDLNVVPPTPIEVSTRRLRQLDMDAVEKATKDLTWIKEDLSKASYEDRGEGIGRPDAGLVDHIVQGTETPRS
ncbi:lysophospholipid acyltransferase [Tremella mesenterica]|uniref:Lysophospholipid acyltransferase n=1 Tax=Tremella mesenterica TaxID=5217 RepID=A0A4Q1BHI0_TREME|nr:lysophospholipid acyltransferase [Tremella mesenterica]